MLLLCTRRKALKDSDWNRKEKLCLLLFTYFRFNRTVKTTTSYITCEARKGSL